MVSGTGNALFRSGNQFIDCLKESSIWAWDIHVIDFHLKIQGKLLQSSANHHLISSFSFQVFTFGRSRWLIREQVY